MLDSSINSKLFSHEVHKESTWRKPATFRVVKLEALSSIDSGGIIFHESNAGHSSQEECTSHTVLLTALVDLQLHWL